MTKEENKSICVWAITPNGAELAQKIAAAIAGADLFVSEKIQPATDTDYRSFNHLASEIDKEFHRYSSHVFIMATGIVVRLIAPHIRHKLEDPAVVVVDELGQWAVSLLSGHVGGANELAEDISGAIGACPVITTATDINNVPAIDVVAKKSGLLIETPPAIKVVNMALLTGTRVIVHDPMEWIRHRIPASLIIDGAGLPPSGSRLETVGYRFGENPGVFVDDRTMELPDTVLILRPPSLAAGIGCNRNTPAEEIRELLFNVFLKNGLSLNSLFSLASIRIKADEAGLLELANHLNVPIKFYDREELNQVEGVVTPSAVVEKHVGVKSVCEAAALMAAGQGNLVVAKQTTRNVTVAVARKSSIS